MKKRSVIFPDKELFFLELEQSRINREKASLILNKSLVLYFVLMIVAIVGFIFEYLDKTMMNILIIVGILLLLLGTIPYHLIMSGEEKKLKSKIKHLQSKK